MSGGVKLRRVIAWMAMMLCVAVLALGHVWKRNAHAGLSRELAKTGRERDTLAAGVMLLDAETRGLRHYSRLEAVARRRLGLVNPGPPIVIRIPDGGERGGGDAIRAARWKGFPR